MAMTSNAVGLVQPTASVVGLLDGRSGRRARTFTLTCRFPSLGACLDGSPLRGRRPFLSIYHLVAMSAGIDREADATASGHGHGQEERTRRAPDRRNRRPNRHRSRRLASTGRRAQRRHLPPRPLGGSRPCPRRGRRPGDAGQSVAGPPHVPRRWLDPQLVAPYHPQHRHLDIEAKAGRRPRSAGSAGTSEQGRRFRGVPGSGSRRHGRVRGRARHT